MRLDDINEGVAGPEKCWPGHRKVGTKPGTGKNAGKRVNDCEKIKEDVDVVDQGEYDREGDMAIGQLNTIEDAAAELRSILDAEDNLPEWVQSKITKAVDYIDTARDYMKSKDGVTEVSKSTLDRYVSKAVDAHGHADFAARQSKNDPTLRSYHVDQKKTAEKRRQGISRALDRMSKEDVAEGLPQTLRKVVPGYAKREIDKKMDAGKFGKTDADKDANFQRYKKIQDKLKKQGVAEAQTPISAGRRAGKAGKPLAPPHPKDSPEYKEFEKGWNEKEAVRKANKLAPYNKQGMAEAIRNTDDPQDDMVEDYLDYLESIGMLDKSREEEKAEILASLEAGYLHSSEIEYALSGTKWDPFGQRDVAEEGTSALSRAVREAGWGRRYSSYHDELSSRERAEQDYMDQSKRDFKRREHEAEWEREKQFAQQQMDKDRGPWYIRIDGKVYKQKGAAKSFDWKRGANNYALAMIKNNPSLQGRVLLTKSAEDK